MTLTMMMMMMMMVMIMMMMMMKKTYKLVGHVTVVLAGKLLADSALHQTG